MRQVESFFFGTENELFGMYHPATNASRRHGVVICPPLFHEYYRIHFTFKRIAAELAGRGYDVLRFDYSGTGDSKSIVPPCMFDAWSHDIGDAISLIKKLGGYTSVTAITARFGATLVLQWQELLKKIICWDPVLDRHRYLEQMEATNNASLVEHQWMSEQARRTLTERDFLGTGVQRAAVEHSLSSFTKRLDELRLSSLPDRSIEVHSEVDWVSASLETIYAHDVIKRVTDSM